MSKTVTLAAGASQDVALTPADYPQLTIHHPRVWWPYRMGAQPALPSFDEHRPRATRRSQTFGIRTITTRLVGASPLAPQGSRQFLVNGVPFTFRAGGWSEDLLLHYSSADTANQIGMIKNLGLNGIRTEGKEMPADFYEQMDRAGILDRRRLPVLRRVAAAGRQVPHHRARLRRPRALGADDRAPAAQPPEHPQLQLVRRQSDPPAGERLAAGLPQKPTSTIP